MSDLEKEICDYLLENKPDKVDIWRICSRYKNRYKSTYQADDMNVIKIFNILDSMTSGGKIMREIVYTRKEGIKDIFYYV